MKMSEAVEISFLKQEKEDLKRQLSYLRSANIQAFTDLQVMLQEGDTDEALRYVNEILGEPNG